MGREVSPIERVIKEEESEEVGGIVSQIFGEQGARKTLALVNKALIDFKNDRVVFWRGQASCQWILLAANNLPVTLWFHESFEDYRFYKTGSKRKGIESSDINVEGVKGIDVEVKWFKDAEDLVERCSPDRANVYYFPTSESPRGRKGEKEKYFYQKKHVELFSSLNNRPWMDHVSILNDENDNVFGDDTKGALYTLQEFELPGEVEDFRKNRISHMGATHGHQSVHYKYHNVKVNDRVYMRRAKVHSQDQDVDQGIVNSLKRGQFVIPGFDKDSFDMPYLPHENIEWMPDEEEVKLRMDFKASIPDIRPEEQELEGLLEEKGFGTDHISDLITLKEAEKFTAVSRSGLTRKIHRGEVHGVKADNDKWLLSNTSLLNNEDVPIADDSE